jgi:WD40 repeat protein
MQSLPAEPGWIRALATAPDGRLALGGEARRVRLYTPESGELRDLGSHESWITALVFLAEGRQLLSCSMDRTVRCWDVATGRKLAQRKLSAPLLSLSLCEQRATVWVGDDAGGLHRLGLPGLEEAHHGQVAVGAVSDLALSPDGLIMALACGQEDVLLWDLQQNRAWERLRGHSAPVRTVCFERAVLFSGGQDRDVRAWDWKEARSQVIATHRGTVWQVRAAPAGGLLSAGGDKSVRLCQTDGTLEQILGEHHGEVRALAAGPGWVASGGQDGIVRFWPQQELADP